MTFIHFNFISTSYNEPMGVFYTHTFANKYNLKYNNLNK